ncbi:MAG: hypothetical protein A2937_02165 [Candidatus Yonathbacteria bacterium RIFCSPLOWO2_01_FULL_47_33b]|uniref:Uncharacterized protein n=1 Tax=Candidatus Yonathbacteria bacterium RIFCSPLOWO2_01_FULL_47_33b TaxID=1802727 RepID=A0A1G2SI43_9BACT|nr:MAG: hypothetical protein A2937_02165 [Candidatus Yonathbacteria bacterium RIFCSPLOWO2_01_FULL_47_33b]
MKIPYLSKGQKYVAIGMFAIVVCLIIFLVTQQECRNILSDVRVCEFRYEFLNNIVRWIGNLL